MVTIDYDRMTDFFTKKRFFVNLGGKKSHFFMI